MKEQKKPDAQTNESGESREKLEIKIQELISKVEGLEEEKATMSERLEEFEMTLVKLQDELGDKNTPKPPPLTQEAQFRKNHPKESYMVKHAIDHGEMVKDKNIKTVFDVGSPFPKDHKLFKQFLKSGQVVQVG